LGTQSISSSVAEAVSDPAVLDWVAALTNVPALDHNAAVTFRSTTSPSSLQVTGALPERIYAASAAAIFRGVLFDGVLYNRPELERECGKDSPRLSDAALLLQAWQVWGGDWLRHVKGIFALLAWDGCAGTLTAVRDPLGAYPLFYARTGSGVTLSTSITALVKRRDVSHALNRAALADHLSHRWPDPDETFYEAVKRIPAGHRLDVGPSRHTVTRYWDPTPPGKPIEWIKEDELARFDELLEAAVARCYRQGKTGIFLSGGFDSISVAAAATDGTRREGRPAPLALSLGFPTPETNEENVQRSVATALGLEQKLLGFDEAVAPDGLVEKALEIVRSWPAPLLNTWMPAYARLAEHGHRHGVSVILTGSGGDEWLTVSPYLSADLIRRADVPGWFRMVHSWKRSFRVSWPEVVRSAVFTFGVRPLASCALESIFDRRWTHLRVRRLMSHTPGWVARDSALRRELWNRAERGLMPLRPDGGFYLQEVRGAIDHPLMSLELEESFEFGRRHGVKMLHPYWDADVVDMLYRTPPDLLNRGGRSKGLVRETVARRFPGLGFNRHKKVGAMPFYRALIKREAGRAWKRLGSVHALADLGIVEPGAAAKAFTAIMSGPDTSPMYRLWDIVSLETWARAHA
jgi:asparagine synthetase B (glutamine-hydrolysing)